MGPTRGSFRAQREISPLAGFSTTLAQEAPIAKLRSTLPTADPPFYSIDDSIRLEILDPIKELKDFAIVWDQIKTKYTHYKLSSSYQFRIPAEDSHRMKDIRDWIRLSYDHFGKPSKLTVYVSYLLRNRKSNEFRFFYQVSVCVGVFILCCCCRVKTQ